MKSRAITVAIALALVAVAARTTAGQKYLLNRGA